jgi:hypothetical protein
LRGCSAISPTWDMALHGIDHGSPVWDGKAVLVAVAGGVAVGGGEDVDVAVPVGVLVGTSVEVGTFVDVGGTVAVEVGGRVPVTLGKMMMTGVSVAVAVARGVRVTTLGTQMVWPVTRLYWLAAMQLANWSWEMLTP